VPGPSAHRRSALPCRPERSSSPAALPSIRVLTGTARIDGSLVRPAEPSLRHLEPDGLLAGILGNLSHPLALFRVSEILVQLTHPNSLSRSPRLGTFLFRRQNTRTVRNCPRTRLVVFSHRCPVSARICCGNSLVPTTTRHLTVAWPRYPQSPGCSILNTGSRSVFPKEPERKSGTDVGPRLKYRLNRKGGDFRGEGEEAAVQRP
jgi:hypothetical protein